MYFSGTCQVGMSIFGETPQATMFLFERRWGSIDTPNVRILKKNTQVPGNLILISRMVVGES